MAREIKLPELGEGLDAGDILDVKVEPGAAVRKGQTLLEIEAEKSTVEVPSPLDGKVTQVSVKKGDRIEVGQTICLIEESGAQETEEKSEAPVEKRQKETAPPARAGKDGAPAAAPAPASPSREKEPAPSKPEAAPTGSEPAAPARTLTLAGPATRRLARELGIDLSQVAGNAPGGRVSQEDVKSYVRGLTTRTDGSPRRQPSPLPDFERWGPVERRPLDAIRRKTAEQMTLAWTIPHVTHEDLADITDLEAFRKQQQLSGAKLTLTAFLLKASAIALKEFPRFNSSLDLTSGQVIVKQYYHLGVAVETEHGLLVPVLRDVDRKSVQRLASELADLAEKARGKKLNPDEMRGGTFTLTNLGGIGGSRFTPIINYPEAAILGVARARLHPWIHHGEISPRLILPLCLSYDHRLIDGADAARFTRFITEMLEQPALMALRA